MVEIPVSVKRLEHNSLRVFQDISKWEKDDIGTLRRELADGTRIEIYNRKNCFQPLLILPDSIVDCRDAPALRTAVEAMEYAWACLKAHHMHGLMMEEPPAPAKVEMHPK